MNKKRTTRKPVETKASKIRALRAQGYKPKEIAAMVGCNIQQVWTLKYLDQTRQLVKTAKAEHKKHVADLQEAKKVLEQPVQFIGKEPKLTIAQRLRVLFTGQV